MAYAASLAGVALALVLTLATVPLFRGASFLLLVMAVAASAALAGLGPSVASAVAAAVGYLYVLVPRLGPQGGGDARLIVFLAVASLIIILSDSGRRATARAREQRRWLEVTISSIGDAVIATDTAGVVSLMNTVAEDLTGWKSDEGVGTPLREVYRTIDEGTRLPLATPDGHASPPPFTGQTVLITRTGREIPIDANVAPIRDEQGGIQGMILVFHDISQRRRNEWEMLQNGERLRLSQQAGRIATWEWSLSNGRFSWSGNIEALLECPPGCFEGDPRSCLERVHPEDRDRVVETARQVRQDRTPFEIEFRIIQADGSFRWLSGKGQAFPDQGGRPDRIIGVASDVTARKYAEEALRASEERFYKAFNSSPLPKWISRLDTGEIVDVNEAFLRSTGFEREEVLGQVPGRFGLWDAAEDLRLAGMVRTRSSGRDLEFKFRRKSGHRQARIFLLSFERITLDGEPCLLAVANDITERKQAEEALRESEERFRLMADTAPVMIWLSGPDKLCTYFNRSWLDFTGRAFGEELGNGWSGGVHPDDLQACLQTRGEAFDRRANFEVEYRMRRADGEYRWVVDVGVPRLTSEGTFAGYIGSCLDITERRKAEQEREQLLERAEAARRRAALLAEASAILASSLEYRTSLQSVAQLAVDHFADRCTVDVIEDGATRRIALAQRDGDELETAALAIEPHALSVLKTGRPELVPVVGREEDGTSVKPGELRATSWMCVPLMARGRILGALTLVATGPGRTYSDEDLNLAQDLANRAAMAVENVQLLHQAQEANRTKDEFLATVSHELRTPLNSILGWARMLVTGRLDQANSSRAVEIIERNAKAQAQLIEDLLDISRIISGKLRLEVRSVDLVPVIESAVDAVRLAAESKGIHIQRVLDSGIGLISGDPDRLQQVVWNLLSNAIKFTPREGRVQVRLEKNGSTARIVVSDTGIGIGPEFLPHVFERFRQVDGSSTRKHGGLGLGLAIVSQLVELHGGGISVESAGTGKGAVFTVSLPVPAAAESGRRVQPCPAAATAGIGSPVLQGIRVLVVEDEHDTREVMTFILQQCGAEVRSAASAGEAFDILRTDWAPHVLVSDIEMPGEDGYALIRRVRALEAERGGRIPAAALTAYARSEDRMRALSAGFQVHVPKPVEPAELIAVVASLSGQTSLVRARS